MGSRVRKAEKGNGEIKHVHCTLYSKVSGERQKEGK